MLPTLLILILHSVLVASQKTVPPCIKSCYDTNAAPPGTCKAAAHAHAARAKAIHFADVAECICSSFYICLHGCPVDEQISYLSEGPPPETHGCVPKYPGVNGTDSKQPGGRESDAAPSTSGSGGLLEPTNTEMSDAPRDTNAAAGRKLSCVAAIATLTAGVLVIFLRL